MEIILIMLVTVLVVVIYDVLRDNKQLRRNLKQLDIYKDCYICQSKERLIEKQYKELEKIRKELYNKNK